MKKIILIVVLIFVSGVIYAGFFSNVAMVRTMSKCTVLTKTASSTTIPFAIVNDWMIIEVEVKAKNGKAKKQKFILDTGAPTSLMAGYVDKESFKKKTSSMSQMAFGGETKQTANYMLDEPLTFKIGDIEVSQPHTLVNAKEPQGFACTGAVGLIGSNLLGNFVVTMDFEHSSLTLVKKDGFDSKSVAGANYKLPFIPLLFQKNPIFSINLNGKEFDGLFDVGFSGDIMLTADSTDEKVKSRTDGGIIRQFETYAAMTNINGVVKTKGMVWGWPQATFTNEDKGALAKGNISILKTGKGSLSVTMGLNYMRQYDRVVVDWKSDNIYFFGAGVKKQDGKPQVEVRIRHLTDERKFVIGLIDVASSFYKNGLRAGDVVSKVSNTDLAEVSPADECNLSVELSHLTANAESYTVVRDGKEIVINKVAN